MFVFADTKGKSGSMKTGLQGVVVRDFIFAAKIKILWIDIAGKCPTQVSGV